MYRRHLIQFFILIIVAAVAPKGSIAQKSTVDTTASDVGYLKIDVPPRIDSLYVVRNNNFNSPNYIANQDTIALPVGKQYVTLAMKRTRDFSFPATVRAGEITPVRVPLLSEKDQQAYLEKSSYPVLRNGVNLVVVTDRDSRISIDGEPRGMGSVRLRLSAGRYLIEAVHPEAGRTQQVVTVQTDPPRLTRTVMYNKPNQRRVRTLSVVPGLAQFAKGHDLKGMSFLTGFALTAIGGVQQSFAFANQNREYEQSLEEYRAAESEEEAFRLGNRTERLFEEARGAYWRRNVLVVAAAGIYLYSIFDAWLNRPEGGYRTPMSARTQVEPILGTREQGVRLVVRF